MRNLWVSLVAAGVLALLAQSATAQPPGGRGMFGGPGMLLQQKAVQEDLKLDEDQIKKAKDALDKVAEEHKDDRAKLRDQNTSMEERAEIMKKITADTEKALKDVLKPEQTKRLNQIQLQVRGVDALNEEEVQKELKLSSEQKEEIKTITDDLRKQRGEVFRSIGGFDPEKMAEARKKMEAMNTEAMEKVGKVLKVDQKKSFDDLKGAKFDTSKLQFGPPRRQQQNQ
jgi:Spy/CpxP family protein refolding chaperone